MTDPDIAKSHSSIEDALQPLRNALRAKGTANVTSLRLKPGTAVNAPLLQRAIDEIIAFQKLEKPLGKEESACMQLAKIVMMDSAYL